ncbi:MAG: SDR family oxidoreductase, partial [Candidatus Parvarchaeota archaeon]
GLLGSKLLDLFDDACFTYNATRIERKNAYQLDITDNNALKFLLEKVNPKTVIVTAALTDVDKCEVNPELAYKINAVPFHYIIDYLKKVNGRFIQISTDYVFSGNEGNYSENDNRKPINVYGKTKMNAEDIIMNSSIDYTIIRTSGIFGLNQATGKTNFFLWIYNSLKDNKEIYLVRDQYYSPTYNSTLANAVREIVDRDLSGIIHFSSKDRITRYDFGILVADIFNLEKTLIRETIMENMKWSARRPRDSSLNNEKAIKLFNNKPINVIDELKLAKEKMREQSI